MKSLYVLLALLSFVVATLGAEEKPKKSAGSPSLKYTIEYGKLSDKLAVTSRIKPNYPKELRAAGVQGTVTVRFTVEGDGRVSTARGSSLLAPELEKLAAEAVSQWKFVAPYSRPGVFTSITSSVQITFRLVDRPADPAP